MKKITKKRICFLIIAIIGIALFTQTLYFSKGVKEIKTSIIKSEIPLAMESNIDNDNEKNYLYLSDLDYITTNNWSYVSWGSIKKDMPPEGSTITLKVNGKNRLFLKGLGIHANAQLIYDISELSQKYTRFATKAGIDASRGSSGDGVWFQVSVSNDGSNWTQLYKSGVVKGTSEALDIDVNIEGYKYLRIIANKNGNNASDHAVLGGAKLVTSDFSEDDFVYDKIHTLEYYDNILGSKDVEYNYENNYRLVLEREFVNKIGYDTIVELVNFDDKYRKTFDWLLSTDEILEQTIEVGEIANSQNFIKIITDLYTKYEAELAKEDGDVYTKMIIAMGAAYTTDRISSALAFSHYSPRFDYMARFDLIKSLYDEGASQFYNRKYFGNYHIELIRTIMQDGAREDEVRWLNYYVKSKNYNTSVYAYVNHTGSSVSYNDDVLYTDKETYDSKFHLSEYGVPFGDTTETGTRIRRQWMIIQKGGICWNQSRVFTSLCKSNGRPAIGSYQPGHESSCFYVPNDDGKTGYWNIANNIFGWGKSSTKWYGGNRYRTIFDWGNKSFTNQIENGKNSGNATAYIYLGQANLNRYEDYKKSLYYNLIANSYSDHNDKVTAYNKAIEVCEINLDSYDYKIKSYKALNKTSNEWYELANDIITNYTYYPMAMYDLLKVIKPYLDINGLIQIDQKEYEALQRAKNATSNEVYQYTACNEVAKVLLGGMDRQLATFSFDGENAGKIILSSEYDGRDISWHYSIDGGTTVSAPIREHSFILSSEEIASITTENDIKIYLDGVSIETPVYTIDIQESAGIPNNIYANDLENKIIAAIPAMQWKLNEGDEWTLYRDGEPDLTGNTKVFVRMGPTGARVAGEAVEYTFTEDNQPNTRKYIPIKHLSVKSYSTQSKDPGRPFYAPNAIDGNINTMWHTDFAVSIVGSSAFITIELDTPRNIAALEFVQRKYKVNDPDYVKNAIVYVSYDGESWIEAGRKENCPQNGEFKVIELNEKIYGKYVKLQLEGYSMFASAAMINLYEDTTIKTVANFSFDGENAGKIVLVDEFKGSSWEYSLNSGETWKTGEDDSHQLTKAEIEQINENDRIKIRFDGNEKEYSITILAQPTPTITAYKNDLENRLIGMTNTDNLEWKIEKITEGEAYSENNDEWTPYPEKEPIVQGNAKLLIRGKARGLYIASDSVEFIFTEDNQPDTEKYVTIEHLSIEDFSNTTPGRGEPATNAIDGNANTMWHTNRVTTTMGDPRWIIIKLDEPKVITKLQYVKKSGYTYGILKDGKISTSMDGENWEDAAVISNLYNPTTAEQLRNSDDVKDIKFTEAKQAKYIKIECTKSCDYVNGSRNGVPMDYFLSAAMINLFEDTSKTIEAEFSFDGENAGKIIVHNEERDWQYSLDGGETWKQAQSNSQQLTAEELEKINSANGIKISLVGEDVVTTIAIGQETAPAEAYLNDLENRPIGLTNINKLEWKYSNDDAWTSYSNEEPSATGNRTLLVRTKATGTNAASDVVEYTFTEDNQPDTRKYVPIARLSIHAVSSEAIDNAGNATNAIDGNRNTRWHSDYEGNDTEKYIVIKFDKPIALSAIEYIPTEDPNGRILNGQILGSMDGENFIEITEVTWADDQETKKADFEEPVEVIYVKIVGKSTSGNRSLISATMFNFYQDITKKELPVPTVTYSTTEKTNQDVIATVTFDKENVTVEGGNTYTFTENGEHIFEYVDAAGNRGEAIAKVTWIDKVLPVPTISYSLTEKTHQNVIATITFDKENVRVEGGNTYTFTKNGEHIFKYVDEAGNTGEAIAKVTWIDSKLPIETISYDITKLTNKDVKATITFDKENVIVEGGNTYTFTENGEHIFRYVDEEGNKGTAIARVTWIDKVLPVPTITYSTTDKTNQDVKATITFDKENVTVEGGNTYLFTENGEHIFKYIDEAGNTGEATAKVTWIDRVLPVPIITYNITGKTNQNVIATITFDKENVTTEGGNIHLFTENGEHIFRYVDEAGNEGEATATVTWIDKALPVAKISYNITETTNQNVVATITFDKENVKIINNEGNNTYTFTENESFTFEFEDEVGNKGEATATVTWIDKVLPVATISYNITETTNQNVVATITFDKENVKIINNEGSNTYTFAENGSFTFEFEDEAGNKGEATATVTWIYKESQGDKITSDKYIIKEKYITKIDLNTDVKTFKENVTTIGEVVIMDKNQNILADNQVIHTGMTIKVGETLEYTLIVPGDINGDGKITITDLAQMKLHFIEKELLNGSGFEAADINCDGKVSLTDIAQIKLILIK